MIENQKTIVRLHEALAAVCPIHGASIGERTDKSTWRIDFAPEATEAQQAAAKAARSDFEV